MEITVNVIAYIQREIVVWALAINGAISIGLLIKWVRFIKEG